MSTQAERFAEASEARAFADHLMMDSLHVLKTTNGETGGAKK